MSYKFVLIIIVYLISLLDSHAQLDTLFRYYENGKVKSKTYSVKSKIYEKVYFENGQLNIESILNKDSIPILLISYNENGNITMKIKKRRMIDYNYTHNSVDYYKLKKGKLHGIAKSYINNKLVYKMKYNNGIAEGEAFGYSEETEKIIAEEYYINGSLNGEGRYYTSNHVLQRKIFYENGCPYKAQSFDESGNLRFETTNKELINIRFRSTEKCQ